MTIEQALDEDYLSLLDMIDIAGEIEATERLEEFLDRNQAVNGSTESMQERIDGLLSRAAPHEAEKRRQDRYAKSLAGLKAAVSSRPKKK